MRIRFSGPRTRLGLAVAAATILVDQGAKLALLGPYALGERGRVEVLPFLDLVLLGNTGISYGLFQSDSALGRVVLAAIAVVAAFGLFVWLARERRASAAIGLGLVAGGALGNAIDRVLYGSVVDFVLLHWGGFEWYVFNIADAAIVAGVALLLYGAVRGEASSAA
jgi:signal peptidase II